MADVLDGRIRDVDWNNVGLFSIQGFNHPPSVGIEVDGTKRNGMY
jgi:hypothetical protein